MKILIAGYPYIRKSFLKTFIDSPEYIFLLPKIWKAKRGEVVFHPPHGDNILKTSTLFYHSNYPIIGGILKGWMPAFPLILWKKRRLISLVYSPLEPILLSTLYQGVWSKIMGKKHIIFTWENVPYTKFNGFNGWIKKIILRLNVKFCDGIICGNHKAREIISSYFKGPISVIPLSGLDIDFFKPIQKSEALSRTYELANTFVFSFIGALGYRKGIHIILEALRIIRNDFPHARLIIAGSGEYKEKIQDLISQLHLNNTVLLIPWLDMEMTRDVLSLTDVFLYPSIPYGGWEEQFGYSIAEAMAMKIAVIATHSGSIDELIKSDENGILIPPNNAVLLAKSMKFLIDNPAKKDELAQAGRDTITRYFSIPIIAQRYHDFFSHYGT